MISKMVYCILTVSLVIQSFDFTVSYKKKLVKEVTSVTDVTHLCCLACCCFFWEITFVLSQTWIDLSVIPYHCALYVFTCSFVNLSLSCSNYALLCLKVKMPHARTLLSFVHPFFFFSTGAVCDVY